MEDTFLKSIIAGGIATLLAVTACATGRTYRPAVEEPLAKVAENGCSKGESLIVTGQVSKAYESTVVLADGSDPGVTLAIDLPGRGSPSATMRRWFGTSKYELTVDKLNQLRAAGTPVTATIECRGPKLPAVARDIEFANPDGTRVAIGY